MNHVAERPARSFNLAGRRISAATRRRSSVQSSTPSEPSAPVPNGRTNVDELLQPDAPPDYEAPLSLRAFIGFSLEDRIQCNGFTSNDVNAIQKILSPVWPAGIVDTVEQNGGTCIRLRGSPWRYSVQINDDLIVSRRLVCTLLKALFERGWRLEATMDIVAGQGRDTLVFKHHPPQPPRQWFTIHLCKGDRVILIDAPDSVNSGIRTKLATRMKSEDRVAGAEVFKLRGLPLGTFQDLTAMLSDILDVVETQGYSVYTNIALAGRETGYGRDSWICYSS